MTAKRMAALAVLVIMVLGLGPLDLAGQTKNKGRARSRKATANANGAAAVAPTPALPPEPEPVKKNERTEPIASPEPTPNPAATDSNAPLYTYEFTQPNSLDTHVVIEHDENGEGHITFGRRTFTEPVTDPIQISPAAWARIKGHWDALHFLDSDQNYQTERQYANMGMVSLRVKIGTRQRTAEFNWTNDKEASGLADEYRRVGEQAKWFFDINYSLESDPLAAPDLMRRCQDMIKRGDFSDLGQLAPMLQDLSVDERIPLIARNHAAQLLKQISKK